ncbi:hypothetical protein AURDEDRAFT_151323 [Auricularia subglabra TFB-10046 SS5]|nr:hypothetical protein AURDEDRAFT_151323 [Auricularia subglabra TFB-10046 SS5]
MKTTLLFPVLRRAARLLVSLSLRVIAPDADALLDSISVPAPFLRTLRLSVSDHTKEAIPWPAELLGGAAPRLTSVNVDNVAFPPLTPAFVAVGDLTVSYGRNNQCLGHVGACFPNVRRLVIFSLQPNKVLLPRELALLSRLDSLIMSRWIQLTVMVPAFDAIRRIRVIEFGGWEAISTLPQFMRHCGPVQLVVEEHDRPHLWGNRDREDHTEYSQLRISLAFTHHEDVCGPARRVFDCDIAHVDSFQLLASFGVAPNLTAVTIDDRQLRTFMDKFGILPALVTLSVVLVVWADTPPGEWDSHFTCEYYTKKSCSCYGFSGYFSDNLDDRWPSDACTPPVFPALRTLALHAARAGSSISAEVLLALSRALTPQGNRLLDLELWRGLRADTDTVAPAFRSVASFGEFDPASRTAARVEALRRCAGGRKGNVRTYTICQRASVRSDRAVGEYTVAIAAQAGHAAAQSELATALGLSSLIAEAVDYVRVNRRLALSLSRRIQGMTNAVISALELVDSGAQSDVSLIMDLKAFDQILKDVHEALHSQGQHNYMSQLLHQKRDKDNLDRLSRRIDEAFDVLTVKLRLRTNVMASALSTQLDELMAKHRKFVDEHLERETSTMLAASLPPTPQLHFGRYSEMQDLVATLTQTDSAARVAILGGPGMGKTTLAAAILHHPAVGNCYGERRYFVPCDAAEVSNSLRLLSEAFGISASDEQTAQKSLLNILRARGKRALLFEPLDVLLKRWDELQTAMLRRGDSQTRLTSLDVSISLSLQSSRIQTAPGSLRLLSALCLLPCGAAAADLELWNIPDVARALAALLRASLATRTSDQRISVLAPIRSFMLARHPPSEAALAPVYDHFFGLAAISDQATLDGFDQEFIGPILPELSNIDAVARYAFVHSPPKCESAVKAAVHLCAVYDRISVGPGPDILDVAQSVARRDGFERLEAELLHRRALLAADGTVHGDVRALLEQSRDICRRIGSVKEELAASLLLMRFLLPQEAEVEGRRLYKLAEQHQLVLEMSDSHYEMGLGFLRGGKPTEALAEHKSAIALLQCASGPEKPSRTIAGNTMRIGACYCLMGDFTRGISAYQDAVTMYKALHFSPGLTIVYGQLAGISLHRGCVRDAIEYASSALELQGATVQLGSGVRSSLHLAMAQALIGNHDAATAALGRMDEFEPIGGFDPAQQSEILEAHGVVALYRGDIAAARAYLQAANAVTRGKDRLHQWQYFLMQQADTLLHLCEVEWAAGNMTECATHAVTAAVIFRHRGNGGTAPAALLLLAEAVDDDLAEQLLETVFLPLLRSGSAPGLAHAFLRSAIIAAHRGERDIAIKRATKSLEHFGDIREERRLEIARRIMEGSSDIHRSE